VKRQFRTDGTASYYEVEGGDVFHVSGDGTRTRVTDPATQRLLLNGAEARETLIERAARATGATPSLFESWTEEELRRVIAATQGYAPPPGTSAARDTWGKKLTVGDLTKRPKEQA